MKNMLLGAVAALALIGSAGAAEAQTTSFSSAGIAGYANAAFSGTEATQTNLVTGTSSQSASGFTADQINGQGSSALGFHSDGAAFTATAAGRTGTLSFSSHEGNFNGSTQGNANFAASAQTFGQGSGTSQFTANEQTFVSEGFNAGVSGFETASRETHTK